MEIMSKNFFAYRTRDAFRVATTVRKPLRYTYTLLWRSQDAVGHSSCIYYTKPCTTAAAGETAKHLFRGFCPVVRLHSIFSILWNLIPLNIRVGWCPCNYDRRYYRLFQCVLYKFRFNARLSTTIMLLRRTGSHRIVWVVPRRVHRIRRKVLIRSIR